MWEAFLERLKEPSSYAGIAFLLALIDVKITPEVWAGWLTCAGAFGAVLAVFIPETKK